MSKPASEPTPPPAPPRASGPRVAAFFDMDRTLVSRNTGTLYALWLRRHGRMRRRALARALWWMFQYKLGIIRMERVSVRALAGVAGEGEEELRAFCELW